MDCLSPALHLVLCVQQTIEQGQSVRQGILRYLQESDSQPHDLSVALKSWLILRDQGLPCTQMIAQIKSPYRRCVVDLLECGLRGESILPQLMNLRSEIIEACVDELERRVVLLPLQALIPLLLLQFPALAILFLTPLLRQLSQF